MALHENIRARRTQLKLSQEYVAEKLGVSRKTIAYRIKLLKEKGIIQRVGSDKKGYWKITDV